MSDEIIKQELGSLYHNVSNTLDTFEKLIEDLNLQDIIVIKSQLGFVTGQVDSLSQKIIGNGSHSYETRIALLEKGNSFSDQNIKDLKSQLLSALSELKEDVEKSSEECSKEIDKIDRKISDQIKSEHELRAEKIRGFWKWSLVASPGIFALLHEFLKNLF
jgi:gas vesicle protein